jgi:hypothetical protein
MKLFGHALLDVIKDPRFFAATGEREQRPAAVRARILA